MKVLAVPLFVFCFSFAQLMYKGSPDPPKECTITHSNLTLMIVCVAGFHQGDSDFFCYLELLDPRRNEFTEQARKKHSCTFLLTDVDVNNVYVYRLYTENKYGNNRENGLILRVGGAKSRLKANKSMIISVSVAAAVFVAILMWCTVAHSFHALGKPCGKDLDHLDEQPDDRSTRSKHSDRPDTNEVMITVGDKVCQMRRCPDDIEDQIRPFVVVDRTDNASGIFSRSFDRTHTPLSVNGDDMFANYDGLAKSTNYFKGKRTTSKSHSFGFKRAGLSKQPIRNSIYSDVDFVESLPSGDCLNKTVTRQGGDIYQSKSCVRHGKDIGDKCEVMVVTNPGDRKTTAVSTNMADDTACAGNFMVEDLSSEKSCSKDDNVDTRSNASAEVCTDGGIFV